MSAPALAFMALAAVLAAGTAWFVMRTVHRRSVEALRARHHQQQLELCRKLEQAKRQVGQLQQELAAARLESSRRRERAQAIRLQSEAARSKEALSRQLDEAPQRARLPPSGFADTLPSPTSFGTDGLMMG